MDITCIIQTCELNIYITTYMYQCHWHPMHYSISMEFTKFVISLQIIAYRYFVCKNYFEHQCSYMLLYLPEALLLMMLFAFVYPWSRKLKWDGIGCGLQFHSSFGDFTSVSATLKCIKCICSWCVLEKFQIIKPYWIQFYISPFIINVLITSITLNHNVLHYMVIVPEIKGSWPVLHFTFMTLSQL